jgi:hypothetical protein
VAISAQPIHVRLAPGDTTAVDLEVWQGAPIRVPLELLEDAGARKLRLDQLRDLILLWVTERPNDSVPSSVDELTEQLIA